MQLQAWPALPIVATHARGPPLRYPSCPAAELFAEPPARATFLLPSDATLGAAIGNASTLASVIVKASEIPEDAVKDLLLGLVLR